MPMSLNFKWHHHLQYVRGSKSDFRWKLNLGNFVKNMLCVSLTSKQKKMLLIKFEYVFGMKHDGDV